MNESQAVVREEPDPGIVVLRLNRPQSLNALTDELLLQMNAQLDAISRDAAVRAVVLTGTGRGFSSGHDLGELMSVASDDPPSQLAHQQSYSSFILRVAELPQPTIAAVNGPAAGGGLAVALACDTRVCAASARFNAAAIRIGISSCDVGISYLLPRAIGPTAAFEMMLTGRLIDAEEAWQRGLVLRVVPDGHVLEAALEVARAIAANEPFAVRLTKQTMWANLDASSLRQAILLEDRSQTVALQSDEWRGAMPAMARSVRSRPGKT